MRTFLFLLFALLLIGITSPLKSQQRVKIMQYNLLQFGNQDPCAPPLTDKDTWLRSVLNHYRPDILAVNEMVPNIAYANRIKQLGFNFTQDIEYGELTNDAGSNISNMIFYNETLFGYDANQSTVISNPLRDINVYVLYDLASVSTGDTTYLYCIVAHLKAGQSTSDATTRAVAAQSISDWISTNVADRNVLVMGDLNLYFHTEQAYQTLVLNSDTTKRLIDPTGLTNGWGGSTNAIHMTQSTRSSASDCGAGGGMDDRFDFILTSKTLWQGMDHIRYVPGSYAAYGNDGLGFNGPLNCTNNTPVPSGVCLSLRNMSDHLPVVMELDFDMPTNLRRPQALANVAIQVLGNPAKGQIRVNIQDQRARLSPLYLELLDIEGRVHEQRILKPNESTLTLEPYTLSSGLYLLRLKDGSGNFITRRVQYLRQ